MAIPMPEMASSPAKRKRAAPSAVLDERSDVESIQVEAIPARRKKARFQLDDDGDGDDDGSGFAPSSAPSLADTNTATATFADTNTPLTEASSTRSNSRPRPKKYHCTFPDCNKAFDRPIRLQTHINSHTGERPHACPEEGCDKRFYKPEHLNRHMKEKHSDKSFECTYQVRHDGTGELQPCGKVFESSAKLKRHVAMHEEKEETTCSWEGCGKVFRKQETLQRHIKKDHLNENSYICTRETIEGDACGRSFPTPGQLKGHHGKEHDAPKYWCEICTDAMTPQFVDMMPIENNLDPEFLPTAEDLQQPGDELDFNIMRTLTLDDGTPESLQYPEGVVGFPTYHDLQRHNKLMHPPICPECSKKCHSSKDLAAHVDIEHPVFGTPAPSVQPLTKKKYVCPYDGCIRSLSMNGFSKKGNVNAHVKSAHTKEKNFVCGQYDMSGNEKLEGWNGQGCGLALGSKQNLIGHVRTQHLGLPAALGARTGLQDKDRKRKVKPRQKYVDEHAKEDTMEMEMDAVPTPAAAPSTALAMLTGDGYEELRPYACLLAGGRQGCQIRFMRKYDLGVHMELTHNWQVDDVNEALEHVRPSNVQSSTASGNDDGEDMLRQRLEQEMGNIHAPNDTSMMIDPHLQSTFI